MNDPNMVNIFDGNKYLFTCEDGLQVYIAIKGIKPKHNKNFTITGVDEEGPFIQRVSLMELMDIYE